MNSHRTSTIDARLIDRLFSQRGAVHVGHFAPQERPLVKGHTAPFGPATLRLVLQPPTDQIHEQNRVI